MTIDHSGSFFGERTFFYWKYLIVRHLVLVILLLIPEGVIVTADFCIYMNKMKEANTKQTNKYSSSHRPIFFSISFRFIVMTLLYHVYSLRFCRIQKNRLPQKLNCINSIHSLDQEDQDKHTQHDPRNSYSHRCVNICIRISEWSSKMHVQAWGAAFLSVSFKRDKSSKLVLS